MAIDEHRVQWMNLVPTMMLRMHRAVQADPDRYDLSSLRVVWHMAAPCPEWLKEAWIELVGPDTLMELYGGTEGQAATIITGTEWLTHRGSVGKPLTGQMKVLDAEGNPVRRRARSARSTCGPSTGHVAHVPLHRRRAARARRMGVARRSWVGWTRTATST